MANIELDGANKKIKVDSGDLTLDIPGDIILDADGGDLTFADGGTNLLKVTNSSSDVVLQPQVDAKDIIFKQYDGRNLLEINDGGYVAIANGATGPGQLRLYEDTDNGTNYTALQVGTQSGDITYTLPTADGSNGHALTTNGSGTLSWASAGTTYAGIDDQSSSNDDQITISDTAVIINEDSDDLDFRVETNGNANMLFISGGNDVVGIGSEGDLGRGLHIKTSDTGGSVATNATDLVIERAGDNGMTFMNNDSGETFINFGDDGDNDIGQIRYHHAYNRMQLHTNAVERLRIASDGEVSVNDGQVDTNGTVFKAKGAVDETTCKFYHGSTSGNQNLFVFYDGAAENCGSISINTASNTVAYNTSSDYRLKENETAITDGITRLKQLKPYRFNWKADSGGDKVDGFFAHEVSSIVPEAIFGTKDAMTTDDDGKTVINPQQIDQAKLVPLLTAAIIELEARVKTLEDA